MKRKPKPTKQHVRTRRMRLAGLVFGRMRYLPWFFGPVKRAAESAPQRAKYARIMAELYKYAQENPS